MDDGFSKTRVIFGREAKSSMWNAVLWKFYSPRSLIPFITLFKPRMDIFLS